MDEITIVLPCYNEESTLELCYQELCHVRKQLQNTASLHILCVDDGSSDHTLQVMKQLANKDKQFRYIALSRNFGKEAALYAGLCHVTSDFSLIMDVDMQDPPNLIPSMWKMLSQCDCVATRRVNRVGEPWFRSFSAKGFYKLFSRITSIQVRDGERDFRLMNRSYLDAYLSLKESNRFSKGIFGWIGFHTEWLEYENICRNEGNSKWSFHKLLLYSLEGIFAFSTIPLAIVFLMGMALCFISFLLIILIVCKTILYGDPVAGYPSMLCMIMLLGGIQLLCIGVVGQYMAKTYLETKKRPLFLIKEKNFL